MECQIHLESEMTSSPPRLSPVRLDEILQNPVATETSVLNGDLCRGGKQKREVANVTSAGGLVRVPFRLEEEEGPKHSIGDKRPSLFLICSLAPVPLAPIQVSQPPSHWKVHGKNAVTGASHDALRLHEPLAGTRPHTQRLSVWRGGRRCLSRSRIGSQSDSREACSEVGATHWRGLS